MLSTKEFPFTPKTQRRHVSLPTKGSPTNFMDMLIIKRHSRLHWSCHNITGRNEFIIFSEKLERLNKDGYPTTL